MSTVGITPYTPAAGLSQPQVKSAEELALRAVLEKQKRLKQQRIKYALGLANESELEKPDPTGPVPEYTEGMGPTAKTTLQAGALEMQGPMPEWGTNEAAALPPAIPERSEALTGAVGPEASVGVPQHIRDLLAKSTELRLNKTAPTGAPDAFNPPSVMEQAGPREAALESLGKGTPVMPKSTAPEPFQVSAEAEQRISDLERKKNLLESLNMAAKGLGQIAGGTTDIDVPDSAAGVKQELAKAQDVLPEAERAWLNQKFALQLPRGISRSALNAMLPTVGRMVGGDQGLAYKREMDEKRLAGTNERFQQRLNMQKAQKATELGTLFDKSPLVKLQKEAMVTADKALQNLASGTQIGEMGALISLARATGEKGPLSDTDVARWAQRRGFLPRLEMWAHLQATGHFTDEHRGEMKRLLEELRGVAQKGIDVEADRWATRYSTRPDLYGTKEDVLKVLQPTQSSAVLGESQPASAASGGGDMVSVIRIADNQPGQISRSALQKNPGKYREVK